MTPKIIPFEEVKSKMKVGDVIAFSGKGDFSEIIKWATRSNVSHIGALLDNNVLIESDIDSGGVVESDLKEKINKYDGEIWWLPLRKEIYDKMDKKIYQDFLIHQQGKEYDISQAIKSAVDTFDNITLIGAATHSNEDFARFFCSELVAAALEESGAIPNVNASEVTPIDLCCFDIFRSDYFQLKGETTKTIRGYNSISPKGWGE